MQVGLARYLHAYFQPCSNRRDFMHHPHNSGSSRRPHRLPRLEPLEDRCVPALGGLLGGSGLGSLMSPVLSPLTALVNPVTSGNPEATSTSGATPSSHSGLVPGLLNVVAGPLNLLGIGSVLGLTHSNSGHHGGGLLSLATNTVSGLLDILGGTALGPAQSLGSQPTHSPADGLVGPLLPVGNTVQGLLQGVTTTGAHLGTGTVSLPGTLADRGVFGVLNSAGNQPNIGASGVAGLADPTTLSPANLAFFLRTSSDAGPNPGSNLLTGNNMVLTPGVFSSLPAEARWGPFGAGEGSRAGDIWAEPLDLALREHRAELAQGEAESAILEVEPTDLASLAPVSAGLVNAADDLGALDRAFQEFLEGLSELRQTLGNWLVRLGPTPWVLMGLAVSVTLSQEIARRRRGASQNRDAEKSMDGVPFSALADA